MAQKAKPVPEGFHTLTPHLTVRHADKAIDFYKRALGAELLNVSRMADGKVMHATLKVSDSRFMLNEEFPGWPSPLGGNVSGFQVHVYVEDVDTTFQHAVSAGATVKMPVADTFWGDRYGQVVDPFGHKWSLATHVKDMSPEEIEAAAKAAFSAMTKTG